MTVSRLGVPAGLDPSVPYGYASLLQAGEALLVAAGACPIDDQGRVPEPDDLAAQARRAVSNLAAVLREAGAGLEDVFGTTVYVATSDRRELVDAYEAVRAEFHGCDPPSTLVGVTLLGYPNQRLEVAALAAVGAPPARSQEPPSRRR